MSNRFSGRLALQQRVLPAYRVPFFDLLAQACERGLSSDSGSSSLERGHCFSRQIAVCEL